MKDLYHEMSQKGSPRILGYNLESFNRFFAGEVSPLLTAARSPSIRSEGHSLREVFLSFNFLIVQNNIDRGVFEGLIVDGGG
jgi:hypothetical protein